MRCEQKSISYLKRQTVMLSLHSYLLHMQTFPLWCETHLVVLCVPATSEEEQPKPSSSSSHYLFINYLHRILFSSLDALPIDIISITIPVEFKLLVSYYYYTCPAANVPFLSYTRFNVSTSLSKNNLLRSNINHRWRNSWFFLLFTFIY